MVAPAGPGVFTEEKLGKSRFRLAVQGHNFTSRGDIEKYLAYRAAQATLAGNGTWFTLSETRSEGDTVEAPRRDPAAKRHSFRMGYWRPVWRYKLVGDSAWKSWSPFSGSSFFADGKDPKSISDFAVTAEIVVHKGPVDSADPLAFEAGALSDFLVNQVGPPS